MNEKQAEILNRFRNKENDIWITKEGKEIKICKMETSHLKNTIRLLEKKNFCIAINWYLIDFKEEYKKMREELKIRSQIPK